MRNGLVLSAVLVLALGSTPASAEMISEYPFSGEWVGGAYSDDVTHQFSHCVASAEYNSGISLLVSITSEYTWNIGLAALRWGLPLGAHDFAYRFDDRVWRRTTADIVDPNFAFVSMPDDETVINLFRRSVRMQVALLGSEYTFDLDGTARLTVELVRCVEAFNQEAASVASSPPSPSPESEPETAGGSGTGILVSATGYVLTNHHMVDRCANLSVTASGSAPTRATLVRSDPANDLALLKTETLFSVADVATFRVGAPLRAGETVAVYGYPLAGMLSQSGNIVAGNITALSGLQDDVRFVQISAPVQPGNSGGPLVDGGGLVVGVVNARMNDVAVLGATGSLPQNVNFAIRGNVAMNFLDAHSISYRTSPPAADMTLVDIAEAAKRYSVFVRCEG